MVSRTWLISLVSGVASCCALLLLMTRSESTIAQKSVQHWITAAPAQRDTSAGTQHMASSGPLVAVIFSGYLKISIPERGATARRFLVEPLAADVLVAGSYNRTTDCGGGPHYECLWEGLQGLEPITWRALSPKLTTQDIGALLNASPHFQTIVKAFQPTRTFHGITNWTPLLGSQRARMLGCARVRLVAPSTPWVRRDAMAHRSLTLYHPRHSRHPRRRHDPSDPRLLVTSRPCRTIGGDAWAAVRAAHLQPPRIRLARFSPASELPRPTARVGPVWVSTDERSARGDEPLACRGLVPPVGDP